MPLFEGLALNRFAYHDGRRSSRTLPISRDAKLNRALYNAYYPDSVAKGGIAVHPGEYIRFVELFEKQEEFALDDAVGNLIIRFFNAFDKGYSLVLEAKRHQQQCLQPAYAKSGRTFNWSEILHSVCVAVTRSEIEKAGNQVNHPWLVKRGGVDHPWNLTFLDDVWLLWGFRVLNFVY